MTSSDELSAGDKVLIICREFSVAMSNEQNNDYRGMVKVTFDDETKCSISNINTLADVHVQEFVIYNGKINQTFAFGVGDNKFLHGGLSASQNVLRTNADIIESSSVKVNIDANGISTIEFQGPYSRNKLQYYGSNRFSCYSMKYHDVSLFRYVEDNSEDKPNWPISFSSSTCEFAIGDSYTFPTLSNPLGAQIIYSSSNSEVADIDANSGSVTIHSPGTTIISAIALENETHGLTSTQYTLIVHDKVIQGNVTFNYENPEGLGLQLPEAGRATPITDNITIYPVTMSSTHGSDYTAIFRSNKANEVALKIYNGGSISYSVPVGYLITTIELLGTNLNSLGYTNVLNVGNQSVTFTSNYTNSKIPEITSAIITYKKYSNTFTITSAGYATYFTDQAFVMPEGVEGAIIIAVNGQDIVADYCYPPGTTVPANTGLLLRGNQGDYSYNYQDTQEVAPQENLLHGLLEDGMTEAEGNVLFYKLAYDSVDGLGFYWGAENGIAFPIAANKAYLAIPKELATRGFSFKDLEPTGITTLETSEQQTHIYDLNGRMIKTSTPLVHKKGIYILNGKKFIVK
jgi:hypothetical protein